MYKTRNLPNSRIDVADALRGIAVAGIILYHSVEHFDIFTQEPIVYTLPCDQTVADVLAWLLSGKMYGIFAMLFGLSFFIMNDNQQQKGRSFSGRFAWRMCLLSADMARHPRLLYHHCYRTEFRGFRRARIMVQAHLQPRYPADDCLGYRLCLVCLRGRSPCAPPSLHLWPHESD